MLNVHGNVLIAYGTILFKSKCSEIIIFICRKYIFYFLNKISLHSKLKLVCISIDLFFHGIKLISESISLYIYKC